MSLQFLIGCSNCYNDEQMGIQIFVQKPKSRSNCVWMFFNCKYSKKYWYTGRLAQFQNIAIDAGDWGSIPKLFESNTVSPTARYRCDALRRYVAQALSRGDGPRHSLHASA